MEAAMPFLKAMGKKIWHCGGPGTGHAAKVMPQHQSGFGVYLQPFKDLHAASPPLSAAMTVSPSLQSGDVNHHCTLTRLIPTSVAVARCAITWR